MNTQTEAMRLADWLLDNVQHINHAEAAAELRRLHEENERIKAPRKPLTKEQINEFFQGMEPNNGFWLSFARAIEQAHGIKEKNTRE